MKGDYHRYLAEFKTGDDRKAATENTSLRINLLSSTDQNGQTAALMPIQLQLLKLVLVAYQGLEYEVLAVKLYFPWHILLSMKRTYLKLPWRPLILIDGSTFYELDEKFTIVRHAESWNVSALKTIVGYPLVSPLLR
ncbi:hypothetical protein CRYUN_Cryun29cG0034400 [Craigia yunnanensis]